MVAGFTAWQVEFRGSGLFPKGPCTQIVYTLGPMYLYREYFNAKVYTIWVHGPLGFKLAILTRKFKDLESGSVTVIRVVLKIMAPWPFLGPYYISAPNI